MDFPRQSTAQQEGLVGQVSYLVVYFVQPEPQVDRGTPWLSQSFPRAGNCDAVYVEEIRERHACHRLCWQLGCVPIRVVFIKNNSLPPSPPLIATFQTLRIRINFSSSLPSLLFATARCLLFHLVRSLSPRGERNKSVLAVFSRGNRTGHRSCREAVSCPPPLLPTNQPECECGESGLQSCRCWSTVRHVLVAAAASWSFRWGRHELT